MDIKSKKLLYVLNAAWVFVGAFEYILSKPVLEVIPTLELLWFKYIIAGAIIICVKFVTKQTWSFRLKDIPIFIMLALFGEIFYFFSGFTAMSYIPIALVTVVISLTPVLSVVFDRFYYRRKVRVPTILGICASLFGISMVAGLDTELLAGGRIVGYILAFLPAVFTNIYNIIVLRNTPRYSPFDIALYLILTTTIILTPYGLSHLPPPQDINAGMILTAVFLAVFPAVLGMLVYINSLKVLGSTTTVLYLNFVPVVSCIFAWLLLGETITSLQMIGGAITITGCAAVIWFKDRTELAG